MINPVANGTTQTSLIQRAPLEHEEAWERSHFSMSPKCSSITSCLFSDSDCFLFWQVECAVHNPEPHINTDSTADTPVLGHGCVWVRNVFPHLSEHNLLFHSEALVLMSSAPPTLDEAFCLNSCVFHKINCDCLNVAITVGVSAPQRELRT